MTLGFQTLPATKLRGSALLLSLDPYLCVYCRNPLHVSLVKSATKPLSRSNLSPTERTIESCCDDGHHD